MGILIVSMFPLSGSGSGTYCINIAKEYLKAGNEVHMIVPESRSSEQITGVDIITVSACGEKAFPVFTAHPESTRTFNDMTDDELNIYVQAYDDAIRNVMENHEITRIHFQHIWCIAALAEKYDVYSIVTCHGTDILGLEKWPRFIKYFMSAFENCEDVIAVSDSQADRLIELRPDMKEKIRIRYNCFDGSMFHIKNVDRASVLKKIGCDWNPERILIFAGKLTEMKGIDILMEASFEMKNYLGSEVKLPLIVIAGSGNLDGYAREFCRSRKLDNVLFTGHISQELLCEIMNISDALVMPSRYEPFGYSAVEAMACGLTVIGSNVDGLREIVTEESGTLFDSEDTMALAEIMAEAVCGRQKTDDEKKCIAEYATSSFTV